MIILSTHDLTRRSTWASPDCTSHSKAFQLTTSQGGRLQIHQTVKPITDTFNSRPHKEVDAFFELGGTYEQNFQLTTSQGGRLLYHAFCVRLFPFNSRPHKEVDPDLRHIGYYFSYPFNSRPHKEVDYPCVFSSSSPGFFQLTTSQGGRLKCPACGRTMVAFQLTTSQGGRPGKRGSNREVK